jgi:hypothetical protein
MALFSNNLEEDTSHIRSVMLDIVVTTCQNTVLGTCDTNDYNFLTRC